MNHEHDHIICMDCGKVFEFKDPDMERRQREISEKHGMELTNHSLYLYGKCSNLTNCDEKNNISYFDLFLLPKSLWVFGIVLYRFP